MTAPEGGGVRSIDWNKIDLTFEEVHQMFREKFDIQDHQRTLIYNFQLKEFDINQYKTFKDYIDRYGLNGRTTVIFLYLANVYHHKNKPSKAKMNKKNESTDKTSIENKFRASSHQYPFTTRIERLVKMVKNMRKKIGQKTFDDTMIQIYEYFCSLRDYTFSTIQPVKKQLKQLNGHSQMNDQSEIELHSNNLLLVDNICRLIKTSIDAKKNQWIEHILFQRIMRSFSEFGHHFQILRNQWLENIPPASSFSAPRVRSTSGRHIQSVPDAHGSQTVPSSTSRRSTNNKINEKSDIFQPILTCLKNSLNLLHPGRRPLPHGVVISTITEIKGLQSNINLFDKQSLCDTERKILRILDLVKNKKFYVNYYDQSSSESNKRLDESFEQILKAIRIFLTSLHRYKLQLEQNSQESPNWSAPPPPFIDLHQ